MADTTPRVDNPETPSTFGPAKSPPGEKPSDSTRARATAREQNRRAHDADAEEDDLEEEGDGLNFISRFFADSASWMTSLVIHMIIIIVLAVLAFEIPQSITTSLSALP